MKEKTLQRDLWIGFALVAVLAGATLALAASSTPPPVADLVVRNARIWTGNPALPEAAALAVLGDRIVAVGSDSEIAARVGPATRMLDGRGRRIVPGFIDSHSHFLDGGAEQLTPDLRSAASPDEFVARMAASAAAAPPGEWLTRGRWDHENWPGAPLPHRRWIDAATGDHPVFVGRIDGHMALANSKALELAGITRSTPDPPGGVIDRDPASGEPTGILREDAAHQLVTRIVPAPSAAELMRYLAAAQREAGRLGITSVVDFGSFPDWPLGAQWETYATALVAGQLTVRIDFRSPLEQWEQQRDLAASGRGDAHWLRAVGVKAYADGSLGSRTALFFEPYADDPATSGLFGEAWFPEGQLERRVAAADAAGLQVSVHAIGERANAEILALYERVAATNGARDRRFRIEHAQHLRPEEVARLARLGVVASMQPVHLADDGRWAEKRLGHERSKDSYVLRSLLAAGAHLAFGTDWPVAPLDPMLGLAAAVARQTLDGKHPGGWHPQEKISIEDALRAYTVDGAWAARAEAERGTIAVGKLADFVVLSDDILSIAPEKIVAVRVERTFVGGRPVFERELAH